MTATATNLIAKLPTQHITLEMKLTGEAPLLMHAPTLLDPMHPITREMRTITDKGARKTIADHERLARLAWDAALYYDDTHGPFISAVNVKRAFRAAAGLRKKGAPLNRGVTFATTKLPLIYDGPRDRDGLYDAGFRDTRPVKNGGGPSAGRVMRTRPCFEEWALEARVYLNPHDISVDDFAFCVADAQRHGIGDYRPEFGLFTAELYEVEA